MAERKINAKAVIRSRLFSPKTSTKVMGWFVCLVIFPNLLTFFDFCGIIIMSIYIL